MKSKQEIIELILESASDAKQIYKQSNDNEERRSFMEQEVRLLELVISVIQLNEFDE
tara:strand:+ start:1327 stop:1497 length:171 start_codon:yes stop_codon:yes gene_type:complete